MRDGGTRGGSAAMLLERPHPLVLLGASALLLSGSTLAALHLLLDRQHRRPGKDSEVTPESYEEELALELSDEEAEEAEEQGRRLEAPPAEERKLSRLARSRRRRKAQMIVGPHIENFPQQERRREMVKIGMQRKEEGAIAAQKCHGCWLIKRHCICAKLPTLDLPVDFLVLLHYKEWLRISNTGHLLPLMHKHNPQRNTGSELLIEGLEETDARLDALAAQAQAEPYSVIALMPSADAITLHELVQRRRASGTSEGRLKVILLDGTWRQGRALNRRLSPLIPRVKLQVNDRLSKFRLRRRTRADGICTIEAASLLVEELGEERGEAYDGVLDALGLLNETVLTSTKKPPKDDDGGKQPRQLSGPTRAASTRAPLPPLRQPLAGGEPFFEEQGQEQDDGSQSDFADALSSVEGEREEEDDDDLVVFATPMKGEAGGWSQQLSAGSTPLPE